jgi:hypothetical protein
MEHNVLAILAMLAGIAAGVACGPLAWRLGYHGRSHNGGAKVRRPWA